MIHAIGWALLALAFLAFFAILFYGAYEIKRLAQELLAELDEVNEQDPWRHHNRERMDLLNRAHNILD
jgi:hypothetical protein